MSKLQWFDPSMYLPSTREGPSKFPRQPVVLHLRYVDAPYVDMSYVMPVVSILILCSHLVQIGHQTGNFKSDRGHSTCLVASVDKAKSDLLCIGTKWLVECVTPVSRLPPWKLSLPMNLLVGRHLATAKSWLHPASWQFGRRLLMLAGFSALPHINGVGIIPWEYSFTLLEEQNSDPDAFLFSDT